MPIIAEIQRFKKIDRKLTHFLLANQEQRLKCIKADTKLISETI